MVTTPHEQAVVPAGEKDLHNNGSDKAVAAAKVVDTPADSSRWAVSNGSKHCLCNVQGLETSNSKRTLLALLYGEYGNRCDIWKSAARLLRSVACVVYCCLLLFNRCAR